ncbi:3D domain-containing protein [Bacillus sp. V59.32b]|uniref:3D domain-containing protein n=1 Tax=Bacillus sp. V59.32b TaxID=1758642 RepID=UPI000E3D0376|nr:3D domain-containing protein [Bacillus sp. V59.32b]RFU68245.1 LysM peptidoglycan-binding domain-containing protein [Bacillus sp. V59.32b]
MKKSILAFAAVAVISGSLGANASAQDVKVKDGDTLWGLSQKYEVSVEELKSLNNLATDTIQLGAVLKVSQQKYHTVKSGDTLWKIAQQYGVTVEDIKQVNKLASDIIQPGAQLAIGEGSGQAAAPQAAPVATKAVKKAAVAKPAASSNDSAPEGAREISVKATAYTASCEGCSGVTATGVNLKANPNAKVIAVDPNVIPLGTKVYVEGYGYATAADTGGSIKGNKIDVFVPNKSDAINWGVKQVTVKILK